MEELCSYQVTASINNPVGQGLSHNAGAKRELVISFAFLLRSKQGGTHALSITREKSLKSVRLGEFNHLVKQALLFGIRLHVGCVTLYSSQVTTSIICPCGQGLLLIIQRERRSWFVLTLIATLSTLYNSELRLLLKSSLYISKCTNAKVWFKQLGQLLIAK